MDKLSGYLKHYPDANAALLLRTGFTKGFRLNYTGPRVHVTSNILKSAVEHHSSLLERVNKEIMLGRIMGPFSQLPVANLHVSPVGLVPKSDGVVAYDNTFIIPS